VLENILAGRDPHFRTGMLGGALYFGRPRRAEIQHRRVAEEIIDFLELEPVRYHPVGSLTRNPCPGETVASFVFQGLRVSLGGEGSAGPVVSR